MEGIGAAASAIAVVVLSAKVASLCLQYSKDVKHAKDDLVRLRNQVTDLGNASESVKQLLNGPNGATLKASRQLLVAIHDGQLQLQGLQEKLRPKTTHQAISRLGLRSLKWPFQSKDVEKIVQDLGRCTQTVSLALQVDQTNILIDIDQKMARDQLITRLPVAEGASFDSHAEEHNPTCLPNTRVELLGQISDWANNLNTKSIFWLNGMAGTGKSTISRTVARSFADQGLLGASFFFKRGEADRGSLSKFFTTLAADLVLREPGTARHISDALDADPSIVTKSAREQFEKLLQQPLSRISTDTKQGSAAIIVVDALDECDRDDDIRLLIRLFSPSKSVQLKQLKLFVTSRPDLPLRLGFKEVEGAYQGVILHEMPEPMVERDISAFLEHELVKIRNEYNASVPEDRQLTSSWPSQRVVQSLAKLAVPLFIVAATVCRFVSDRRFGVPDEQLNEVLDFQAKNQGLQLEQLDITYMSVLNKLVDGLFARQMDKVLQQFRDVIGPIIILASPLSTTALAQILNIPRHTIDGKLDMLHSVLSVPPSAESPVRLLHLSFRDFLVDSGKREKNPFWVDEKGTHKTMAAKCLRVLDRLQQDICDLKAPGTHRSSIDPQSIKKCLPPGVQYACLYWVHHLKEAGTQIADSESVHNFLTCHFLHWMEALSLIDRVFEGLHLIQTLQSLLKPQSSEELSGFLDDAMRFLRINISAIDATPLQIYSSLLVFTPNRSKVRNTFDSEMASWICLKPKVDDNWSQCIQVLEGHSDSVLSVAFSHSSAFIASASRDKTIRIWRTDSGECMQVLEGHSQPVQSVAFSHDSTLIVSASGDNTIRIWRAISGECMQVFESNIGWFGLIAFSHDSALIALALDNKTIRIWRADSGECIQILEGHSDSVLLVAFSHDSALIASASDDSTIRIWRADSGECLQAIATAAKCYHLSFEPDTLRLLTDVGAITIPPIASTSASTHSLSEVTATCRSGYGISNDRCWVMWNEDNLLWLPVEFRPSRSAVLGSTVVLGCHSGKVKVIGFPSSPPLQL